MRFLLSKLTLIVTNLTIALHGNRSNGNYQILPVFDKLGFSADFLVRAGELWLFQISTGSTSVACCGGGTLGRRQHERGAVALI